MALKLHRLDGHLPKTAWAAPAALGNGLMGNKSSELSLFPVAVKHQELGLWTSFTINVPTEQIVQNEVLINQTPWPTSKESNYNSSTWNSQRSESWTEVCLLLSWMLYSIIGWQEKKAVMLDLFLLSQFGHLNIPLWNPLTGNLGR